MSRIWTPCDFETFTDPELRAEFAALSRIGCAALNCVEVDPAKDSLVAFDRLISLFCIVSENTPSMLKTLEAVGEENNQLSQTIIALTVLKEFSLEPYFTEEVLDYRISIFADAATRIHDRLPAEGNPIVEIL